ncbi:lisH and WD40 domain-containing protein mahjong isoform X1 [Tachypleus tridentatus]|uniref:lisH and WD40 domain-containing protein mahjong isoform X1 n=2 Tax=Tachypleus tridentatus TaxID=6853 RepID=UPI003FD5CCF7
MTTTKMNRTSTEAEISAIDSTTKLTELLETWEKGIGTGMDPVPVLTEISELMERETEAYLKMDPDPFDDRHPSRAHPECTLGLLLKALLKNDDFMNKLVSNYILHRENRELNTVACRLLLDILPGLETAVIFQDTEGLVQRLFHWAENAPIPLQSYATGLLAASMEIQENAANFREQNSHLVPLMLDRLHELSAQQKKRKEMQVIADKPFAHLNKESQDGKEFSAAQEKSQNLSSQDISSSSKKNIGLSPSNSTVSLAISDQTVGPSASLGECSNSSWADLEPYMIGSFQMFPLTLEMQQRFILQYLTPIGEYQDLLSYVFEHNAMSLILHYINLKEISDVRLAFEALKYLAALLCHKKFSIEFINVGGLQKLLQVYRPSVAATGVSVCLYYLAYSEDAMERVCLLPQHILSELVRYSLWLLECSHDSSRYNATMFFSLSFAFRVILDLFDAQDGLRKLFNVMSTLDILVVDPNAQPLLNDEQVFASRQAARHVCVALKRYYEAHLGIEAERQRRSHSRSEGGTLQPTVPPYKAARYSSEAIQENIDTLMELMPLRMRWQPVDELLRLGGVPLLLQLIAMSYEWNYSGRAETVRSALDVLTVCSVTPKAQLALCESVHLADNQNTVGMSIVLACAKGERISDPDVQRSALNVIINCVCGPVSRLGGTVGRIIGGSTKKKSAMRSGEDLLSKMWNCVRVNNGIMILLNLLTVKAPITDADSIRTLACKALCGLSRSETFKQIIGKLPLLTSGQLQVLMREPVLQDKRQEHVKFCKHCVELIERVTGAPLTTGIESSIAKINKAEVVAQTRIIYNDKELLQLIHQHLLSKGLLESAAVLHKEAGLPSAIPRPLTTPSSKIMNTLPTTSKLSRPITSVHETFNSPSTCSPTPHLGAHIDRPPLGSGVAHNHNSIVSSPIQSSLPHAGHLRFHLGPHRSQSSAPKAVKVSALEKSQVSHGLYHLSPGIKKQPFHKQISSPAIPPSSCSSITLDSIVTEYLRKQHFLCKNPVVTCPPFDLFRPHQCPEPQFKNTAPINIAARLQRKEIHPKYGGYDGVRLNRNFIYSRFRPVRAYRDSEGTSYFTCCAFSPCDQFLFLGTYAGELKVYNIHTGTEEATYICHESEVIHCEPSKDGKLLLTSSFWRPPLSALWTFTDVFEIKHSFEEDCYVEFSKQSQDRIIGTKYERANIYDLATGQLLQTLRDPDLSNNYTKNRATFDPTDELVLSDGVLWDVRGGSVIHKFDKFNSHINGVFHPNGLEIISNSEIWDLRTFHLLHTVPALDQCQITFNHTGDVIYGAMLEEESDIDEDQMKSSFGSSFRTFNGTDYSSIATIDIKKNIFDLATDQSDCYLAVVENQRGRDDFSTSENICRLYEVGRRREEDDEEEEDEEDSDELDEDDSDDDDDDDDEDDDAEDEDLENEGDQEHGNGNNESDRENRDDDEMAVLSLSEDDSDDNDETDVLFSLRTI